MTVSTLPASISCLAAVDCDVSLVSTEANEAFPTSCLPSTTNKSVCKVAIPAFRSASSVVKRCATRCNLPLTPDEAVSVKGAISVNPPSSVFVIASFAFKSVSIVVRLVLTVFNLPSITILSA